MAAGALALGSALFSGSIYGLVLLKSKNMAGGKFLGPVTPLGGIPPFFGMLISGIITLAGWGLLIL
jgi:uncharacterized membrane protein YgdD (TMEM256/DUF423 family)